MSSIDTTRQIADGLERTRGFLNDHGDEQFFFDKKQFIPQRLAVAVSDVVPLRVTSDGLLRWYDDGVYREGGDKVAAAIAQEFLQEMTTTSRVNEAVAYVQRDQATRPLSIDPDPTDVIRARDGIIDLTSGDLTPYTPENATTVQLPWRWRTGSSEHPKIRAFLLEVFGDDEEMVSMVYEIAGYLCLSRNFLRKAILLYGHGNNGKSILLHLLACLLGADNIAAVPLQRLGGDDRFAPSVLVGKLANICGDVGPNSARDMSLFKQLTGGDPIYAERKGQQGFTFLCGAVPVFSANEYPRSPDTERSYISTAMSVSARDSGCPPTTALPASAHVRPVDRTRVDRSRHGSAPAEPDFDRRWRRRESNPRKISIRTWLAISMSQLAAYRLRASSGQRVRRGRSARSRGGSRSVRSDA